MSGSGWTVDTLKEHFYALRADDKAALQAALVSSEKAISVAEQSNQLWRTQQNEWRGALNDRERAEAAALEKYAQRDSVEALRVSLQIQLDELKTQGRLSQGQQQGSVTYRAQMYVVFGALLGLVGVVVAIVVAIR